MPVTHPVLTELLNANRRFALNAKGTTNHCPMALTALANMGASDARLRAFFAMWEEKYAIPAPVSSASSVSIAQEDWQQHLRGDDFEALQACFEGWIEQAGVDAVLADVLDKIPFAPATGAFHALIRLGYGLEAGHVPEMAAGLAYLMVGNLDVALESGQIMPTVPTVEAGFASISAAMAGCKFEGESIVGRVRAAVTDPRFGPALRNVPITPDLLAQMARLAIALYCQTRNFTVLHMVTSVYAARQVFAHLPQPLVLRLLPQLWVALCAAYASVGAPALLQAQEDGTDGEALPAEQAWAGLLGKAIASDNDHVIKMTYTCYKEAKQCPSALYFAAAGRMVG